MSEANDVERIVSADTVEKLLERINALEKRVFILEGKKHQPPRYVPPPTFGPLPERKQRPPITDAEFDSLMYDAAVEAGFAKCKKCGGKISGGIALESTAVTTVGDFCTDDYCTVNPGGQGRMVGCYKCESCGYSFSR